MRFNYSCNQSQIWSCSLMFTDHKRTYDIQPKLIFTNRLGNTGRTCGRTVHYTPIQVKVSVHQIYMITSVLIHNLNNYFVHITFYRITLIRMIDQGLHAVCVGFICGPRFREALVKSTKHSLQCIKIEGLFCPDMLVAALPKSDQKHDFAARKKICGAGQKSIPLSGSKGMK